MRGLSFPLEKTGDAKKKEDKRKKEEEEEEEEGSVRLSYRSLAIPALQLHIQYRFSLAFPLPSLFSRKIKRREGKTNMCGR